MLQPWTFVIASHAVAASLALVLGPVQLLRRVKGDPLHVVVGRVWAVLMLYVAASSFLFGDWTSALDIFLRALAVWTLISVVMAVVRVRQGNVTSHRGFMTGTYFGLVGAFVGVVAVRSRLVPSWFVAHPWPMSLAAVAVVAVAGFVVAGAAYGTRGSRGGRGGQAAGVIP